MKWFHYSNSNGVKSPPILSQTRVLAIQDDIIYQKPCNYKKGYSNQKFYEPEEDKRQEHCHSFMYKEIKRQEHFVLSVLNDNFDNVDLKMFEYGKLVFVKHVYKRDFGHIS